MVNKKPKIKSAVSKTKSKIKPVAKTKTLTTKKHVSHGHLLAAAFLAIAASCAALAVSNLANAATTITKVILPTTKITTSTINIPTCANVGVYSCRQVSGGIYTRYNSSTIEGFLANGCRDAGHGLRNYSLTCIGTTTYKACYTDCATTSTSSTTALSKLTFSYAPSPTTTARASKTWVGRFNIFTSNQDATVKNLNFMATGTISGTQYYLYKNNSLIATNAASNPYQVYFNLNNYRLAKGVTTTFDIYLNTSQQTIGSFKYLMLSKDGVGAVDAVTNNNVTEISGLPLNIGPFYIGK